MSCSSINLAAAISDSGLNNNAWPSDWSTPYTPSTSLKYIECLPNGAPFSNRDSNGIAQHSDVDSHIVALINHSYTVNVPGTESYDGIANSNSVPPNLTQTNTNFPLKNLNPAKAFSLSAAKLRSNIHDEYCYYYNRYYKLLHLILYAASSPASSSDLTNGNTPFSQGYQSAIAAAQLINNKLNDLISILQRLAVSRNNTLSTYYGSTTGVNQLNASLEEARLQLQSDSHALTNSELKGDIQTSMMHYTIEKNQSSRNLLAIYGFMNIVAIGMIYYLYRNTK